MPVGIHLLVVADLLPPELEHHGLLHDAPEVCVNDVPRPMKTDAAREVEDAVQARIYRLLGLPLPTARELRTIKTADIRAVNAEGVMECGPRGFGHIQSSIDIKDYESARAMRRYLNNFNPLDAINPDGRWPLELERRLRKAVTRAHKNLSAAK